MLSGSLEGLERVLISSSFVVSSLNSPARSTTMVGRDGFCRQPATKHSAQYPARVDSSAHVAIIARRNFTRVSTAHGGKR
jgi:hypothetical protein